METKSIQKYQEFLNKSILIDQTHLISVLLSKDMLEQPCQMYNQNEYIGDLSDGEFWGTEQILVDRKDQLQQELEHLKAMIRENTFFTDPKQVLADKATLEADLHKLKEMRSRKRAVFQWILVPHWFADKMIGMGEVVFRALDCNWWGVSSLLQEYWSKDQLLLDVMEEIGIEDNL